MADSVVYYDEARASSWIDRDRWSRPITDHLLQHDFKALNAKELKQWLEMILLEKRCHNSVVVFSQDLAPDLVMRTNSPNDLIRRYLDFGGKIIWIGDIPFWSRSVELVPGGKDKYEVWDGGTHFAILGVQPLIAESSSLCVWDHRWKSTMKSQWYSQRPVVFKANYAVEDGLLLIEPMAYATVTLLPSSWNALVVTRWKKAGKKVGSFGLSLVGFGGNITISEKFPEELSLKPMRLACAWHISFNRSFKERGFFRIWDCGASTEKPPDTLLDDIVTLTQL